MASTMRAVLCSWTSVLLLFVASVPGALCDDDYTIGGLVAAGGVAFIFLAVVITMLVVGFTWNSWYPAMQRAKGRVKMPREYWKKKEEAKLKLLNGSTTRLTSVAAPSEFGLPNGAPSTRVRDTGVKKEDVRSDTASWVQGWNNVSEPQDKYEEMAIAMDLGEEGDEREDFRIETTVVDNEVLNLGPFPHTDDVPAAAAAPVAAPQPRVSTSTAVVEPVATSTSVRTSRQMSVGASSAQQTATLEMTEEREDDDQDYTYSTVERAATTTATTVTSGYEVPASEAITSFSKLDHDLVPF